MLCQQEFYAELVKFGGLGKRWEVGIEEAHPSSNVLLNCGKGRK